jgi:hypothetical protein
MQHRKPTFRDSDNNQSDCDDEYVDKSDTALTRSTSGKSKLSVLHAQRENAVEHTEQVRLDQVERKT